MLKTFALRGREVPITIYGPPGLRDLFDALRRIFGRLTYTVELKELRPGDELIREDYRLATFAVAHGVSAVGYALVEDARPGRFDVQAADALGIPPGPERGALAARRVDHPRGRHDDHARPGARPGAARAQGRDRGRRGPLGDRDRGGQGRGRPRPRGHVLRGRARAREGDAALDRPGSGRRRSRGGRPAPRSDAPLESLLRRRGARARRGRSSRTRSFRRTSIRSTSASKSEAGRSS